MSCHVSQPPSHRSPHGRDGGALCGQRGSPTPVAATWSTGTDPGVSRPWDNQLPSTKVDPPVHSFQHMDAGDYPWVVESVPGRSGGLRTVDVCGTPLEKLALSCGRLDELNVTISSIDLSGASPEEGLPPSSALRVEGTPSSSMTRSRVERTHSASALSASHPSPPSASHPSAPCASRRSPRPSGSSGRVITPPSRVLDISGTPLEQLARTCSKLDELNVRISTIDLTDTLFENAGEEGGLSAETEPTLEDIADLEGDAGQEGKEEESGSFSAAAGARDSMDSIISWEPDSGVLGAHLPNLLQPDGPNNALFSAASSRVSVYEPVSGRLGADFSGEGSCGEGLDSAFISESRGESGAMESRSIFSCPSSVSCRTASSRGSNGSFDFDSFVFERSFSTSSAFVGDSGQLAFEALKFTGPVPHSGSVPSGSGNGRSIQGKGRNLCPSLDERGAVHGGRNHQVVRKKVVWTKWDSPNPPGTLTAPSRVGGGGPPGPPSFPQSPIVSPVAQSTSLMAACSLAPQPPSHKLGKPPQSNCVSSKESAAHCRGQQRKGSLVNAMKKVGTKCGLLLGSGGKTPT